jgi:signal transduction histidine kinase
LPKIQQQMMQQHSAVEALKIKIGPHEAHLGSVNCPFQLKPVPVYLNGIRAGQITACVSVQKTLVSAWTRPWSLLFLALLCFGLFFWEVRRAKERLLSLKKDLEIRGLEERNLLARQVAHDLRGPLTALQTIVSCKAVSNSYADLAQDVIHRIHGITHELLKSQKKDVVSENQTEVVSLNKKTLQDLIGVLGQELQLRDPTCEVLVSSREDILIETLNLSVIELSRMVSNVMQNSLEARSNSQTRVVIDVRLRRSQDVVILSIKDNGKGIPEHILPLIFSEGATYGKVNGHGLGLFSAKKLLKSRGGDIQISSLPNVGTEVTLMIPVSLAEDNKSQLVL